MPANRDENRDANRDANGRFVAGNCANPSGRPKVNPEVREILKAAAPDAARELVKLIYCKKENIRLAAITEILDRTQGKPESMSKIELSGSNNGALVFRWINEENSSDEKAS